MAFPPTIEPGMQLEPFSHTCDVIAYSRRLARPNQNKEDYPNSTVENNSVDLIGLIQNLALSPAHLVGHSYGGFVAAYTTATHPEHVRTLTLIEPAVSTILLKNRKSLAEFLSLLLTSPLNRDLRGQVPAKLPRPFPSGLQPC